MSSELIQHQKEYANGDRVGAWASGDFWGANERNSKNANEPRLVVIPKSKKVNATFIILLTLVVQAHHQMRPLKRA